MSHFTKFSVATGLCAAIAASTAFAASHAKTDNKAVAARQSVMQMNGFHAGILGAIAKGEREYDSAMVDAAATNLREMAKLERAAMWVPGTEQGVEPGTRAKAEIWSDPDGFQAKMTNLENAADAMIGAADAAAVGAAMGALGGACKGCHDDYRGPEN